MPIFTPHTPAKYSAEKHVPLPQFDDNASSAYYSTSSQLVWSPASPAQSLSPYTGRTQSPNCSPLASFNLATLPSPTWSSAPLNTTIHVLLNPVKTIIDLSVPQFILRDVTSSQHMSAPATNPPVSSMTLTSRLLPYTISIKPSTAPFVTVYDVLNGLYGTLRQYLNPEQQKLIQPHMRAAITGACQQRGSQTLRHIDMLLGAFKFVGLKRVPYNTDDEFWEIVVK